MRAQQDFHVGEQYRRDSPNLHNLSGTRSKRFIPRFNDTPLRKTTMEPIHPYGLMLNLDEVDFKDREVCINDWASSMRIAGDTLELEQEAFIKLLEMSMLGTTKLIWERANENVRTQVVEAGSLTKILNRMATYFKIQYIGIDYFDDYNVEKRKLYTKALHSLKLESLEKNAMNYFFTLITTYQWQTGVGEAIFVEILLPKFQALRKRCSSRNTSPENVARRMSFVKMKLGEWCGANHTAEKLQETKKYEQIYLSGLQ